VTEPFRLGAGVLERLNDLSEPDARAAFSRCCGALRWVEAMLASRPFASASELCAKADAVWSALGASDFLEAFTHHPDIGADMNELRRKFAGTAELSQGEQAGAATATLATLVELRQLNRQYRERFGYGFIVCATGKSAEEMLEILRQRLTSAPDRELGIAAAEQAKITRLRLEKM
jgi:2-oxo-4-hydroxy-4-carboxy-5-ureidoimidazoline decarboxylase